MVSGGYREENIYLEEEQIGQDALDVIKDAITKNNAVGTMIGYYDERLTILSVSDYLLNNLDYSIEKFHEFTGDSLKNIFCGENTYWVDAERFRQIQGAGEGEMLTGDGTPIAVRLYKEDSFDKEGTPIWVMAVRVSWEHENLELVNKAIQSGTWHMDCDEQGMIQKVNWSHEFRKMLGFHDTIDFPNVLESWSDRLHPDDHDRVVKNLKEAISDKTNTVKYNVEYRMKMCDGRYQWFRAIAEVMRRTDGTARRIAGIFINIEEEKKTQRQLQKSNAFHQAFTKLNLCEYYIDLRNNTFESLKVEPSLLTIFEESDTWDELVQAFTDNYVFEEYKEAVKQFYDRSEIARKLSSSDGEISLECPILLEGEIRWLRNVIMPGELMGSQYAMSFLRDITEAKNEAETHRQMAEANESMEQLIHSMVRVVDHFAICNLENDQYEYYSINIDSKYAKTGKYSEFIEMVTDHYKTLKPQKELKDCLSMENLRRELQQDDAIYKFEYCSNKEDVFRMASFVPLRWKDGVLTKVLWISMDVTEEKEIEIASRRALKDAFSSAERANRAKTEFLSNMSHDIRTPMNAIVGLTALAGANIENKDRVIEYLGKITRSSRHLLGLINEVLDMARIESGRIALSDEEFDISELVDNLVVMVKPEIEAHGHTLQINVAHMEHEAVCGDSLRIQQVFTNLMSNAIKYTPNGGNITFSIKEKANGFSELGCFEFTIEDNGIGMTPEFQDIMFQPFSRADDHRTTQIQGTGLGMAITRNIVEMMNGDIEVESAPDKGTKIKVTIYLKLQDKKIGKIKELIDLPVLVVDDEESACESTVAALEDIGINGEWVTSGEEAVMRTRKRHEQREDYFAILMDWQMPGMDGIEATRQIRKFVGNDVTIIVLTAYDYSDIEEEARAAGVDAFITKPLFRSRLTATLKQIVSGKPEKSAQYYMANIAQADYSGKRILLVEDNELNREIATEIISMTNVSVETAVNGKEAVDKIAMAGEGYYDLVFMDIQMPVMNGYEATAAIRSLPGKRSETPIIAMTANAFAEDVQLAKNTGMNGHVAKPLELNKLNEIMRTWLG